MGLDADVIILGGGLAGLALAISTRRQGHNVLVIEKGAYPRHKVCGEYISLESQPYLYDICPALKSLVLPRISRFSLSSTGSKKFETLLGLGGFGISRYLLEDLLYQEAVKTGVQFRLHAKALKTSFNESTDECKVHLPETEYCSRVVCNATGRYSNFSARPSGGTQTNYVGVKYHVRLNRDPSLIELHNFPGGYAGISNIEDGKSCFCYMVNSTFLKEAGSIKEMEKKVLSRNERLRYIFEKAEFIFPGPVTVSGIDYRIRQTSEGDCFFLGDSAGTIAPLTGNGMSMALRSAYWLSVYLDDFLSGRTDMRVLKDSYSDFWKRSFSGRIRLSRHLQKLSEYPRLTNLTINVFRMFPPVSKFVINQTHGKVFANEQV